MYAAGRQEEAYRNRNYRTRNSNWDRPRRPTLAWRLLNNRIRSVDRLEAVYRDCVGSRTHLQGEEFARPSQDLEGTTEQLRERPDGSILANKYKVCRGQSSRNLSSRGRPVMRRRQHQALQGRMNPLQKGIRRNLVGVKELPREAERSSVQSLSCRETRIIPPNRTEAEHDQAKVVNSVWTC